ncbi:hypothetical protein Tco_0641510 [Tanacetum coccineum]
MTCSVPHNDDEIQALVQKLIDEDMVRQKAILDLALQFDNACTAKDDLKKAYEIMTFHKRAKELHQLHLDEEALRETLEEEAMDEKDREEKIREKQADDEQFMLEFGVKYDSEYEPD